MLIFGSRFLRVACPLEVFLVSYSFILIRNSLPTCGVKPMHGVTAIHELCSTKSRGNYQSTSGQYWWGKWSSDSAMQKFSNVSTRVWLRAVYYPWYEFDLMVHWSDFEFMEFVNWYNQLLTYGVQLEFPVTGKRISSEAGMCLLQGLPEVGKSTSNRRQFLWLKRRFWSNPAPQGSTQVLFILNSQLIIFLCLFIFYG